jgi:hypothetical protein
MPCLCPRALGGDPGQFGGTLDPLAEQVLTLQGTFALEGSLWAQRNLDSRGDRSPVEIDPRFQIFGAASKKKTGQGRSGRDGEGKAGGPS